MHLLFLSGSGTAAPVLDFKSLYSLLSSDYRIVVIEKFGYLTNAEVIQLDCGHYVHNYRQDIIAEKLVEFIESL